jgi:hypothetical protein
MLLKHIGAAIGADKRFTVEPTGENNNGETQGEPRCYEKRESYHGRP